ncbi:MAG: class I SAM-dependent DNA methyltransferase [Caldicoprobacterales bacterium]|nr:class I SAM-dependent methyltransferase [Clostridiales bacterium]
MYQDFAYYYDTLMKNVDYSKWTDHVEEIFRRNGKQPKTVVDLACGTGGVTNILAARGYQVTGIDISEDMLFVAGEKARKSGLTVSYVCQDMTELTLHRPVDAIICMCDGFNYILEDKKIERTMQRIFRYLNPGGILVFDISTYYKLSSVLGDNTMADNDKEISFIWLNNFDKKTRILEMNLTFFKKENGMYRRSDETHFQRAYYNEEIVTLLEECGFSDIKTYSANDLRPPGKRNHRVFFSAAT